MTKAIDKATDASVNDRNTEIVVHADTLNTGEAVFSKGVLSFGMTEFKKDAEGNTILDGEGKKIRAVVSTFAIRYHKGGVKRTYTEILKESVLPAIEASGMGESLAQSFVKTNIPVFLRKKLPAGFTGSLVQALNVAGANKGKVINSQQFTVLHPLSQNMTFVLCESIIKSMGWEVSKGQFKDIKNGLDPFRSED